MLRLATNADVLALKRIWDDSFHDSVNYIDFVFDHVATPDNVLLCQENTEIAAMLIMIPVALRYGEERAKAMYIFGAATKREFRNKGVMTRMLDEAERIARDERNMQLSVLVPAERYLFDYYKKRGYSPDFKLRAVPGNPDLLETALRDDFEVGIDRVFSAELYEMREQALINTPHIEWSAEQVPFVIDDGLIYGDHVANYDGDAGKAYAMFSNSGRRLYIKECLGTSNVAVVTLIRNLAAKLHPKSFHVNLPVDSTVFAGEGDIRPYGMAKPLTKGNKHLSSLDPYMNIMLD